MAYDQLNACTFQCMPIGVRPVGDRNDGVPNKRNYGAFHNEKQWFGDVLWRSPAQPVQSNTL
jgi:hypothetical protein